MFKFRPEKRYSAWPWPLTPALRGAGCSHCDQQELGTRPHRGAGGSRPSSPAQMVPTKSHSEAELGSARPPLPQPHPCTETRLFYPKQPRERSRHRRALEGGSRAPLAAGPLHTPASWYFFPEGETEDAFHKQTISAANFTITYGRLYD